MTGEGNATDKDEKKKKTVFSCRSANFTRYLILLLSTGIFILGQYKFAGSVIFSPSLHTFERTFTKQRRNLHDDLVKQRNVPTLKFSTEYHVTGTLKLPYGDIIEPFEAWYSAKEKMSRIDYYGGMDRTYQREDIGDYGFAAKVIPEYSEEKNKTFRGCLHHVGTKRFPIHAQSIVPSPKLFKFKGNCELNDSIPCWKWMHKFTILTKVNTYTLYTTRSDPASPLRYEMMGYDTLLTSYYDKYILQYRAFEPWKYDFSTMEIPTELHCFDLSNNEASEATVSSFNPMLEFISHQNGHVMTAVNNDTNKVTMTSSDDEIPENFAYDTEEGKRLGSHHFELVIETVFRDFKNLFNKNYKDDVEHVKRKDIFRHNLRFIHNFNRQHRPYKLKMNHFADVTDKEMQKYKGLLNESYHDNSAKKFVPPKIDVEVTPIPKTLDWREYGAVAKVRSQGICGSCYAYAVTGAIEGAHYLKTGDMVDLSVQQIVDCSWGFANKGCKGGYPYRAMQWIVKHGGIATRKSYGNYLAQEGYCHFNNITNGASLEGYFNVSAGNSTELKMALALYGPVTVLINTRPRSFKFYDSGVYYDKKCDRRLDHAALAVGYGEENGQEYWLIKNSWSLSWGSEGFIKISARNDNCGVTQKAVVVEVKKKS